MRPTDRSETWVVYRVALRGTETEVNAVCEQSVWEVMEATRPGCYTLVRAGIASEGEAERLARGTSGDPLPRATRPAGRVIGSPGDEAPNHGR
jgi:hypothetical protein